MVLDECAPFPCDPDHARSAMERSVAWAARCLEAHGHGTAAGGWPQALFAIVQGSVYRDLREQCCAELSRMDFPGYAIGGLAVGEDRATRNECVSWCTDQLPVDKPRYLMGVGTPLDILDAVERGVDMFDCVLPTRNARNAQAFTARGTLNLRNARFGADFGPIDPECACSVCTRHTRAYLRHLFQGGEILAHRLLTYHNLSFYAGLMRSIRDSVAGDCFVAFRDAFVERYTRPAT
jgi:queuine tRNA-ribosyltransferase